MIVCTMPTGDNIFVFVYLRTIVCYYPQLWSWQRLLRYYAPALIGGELSDAFVWRLFVEYIGPKSRTERPRKTKIGTEVAHVTRDSDTTFKVKGRGHQAALLNAVLMREAGAAVTVRTYWAWETTATLRLLGGARGAGAPTGGWEGREHIVSPHAQLVIYWHSVCWSRPSFCVQPWLPSFHGTPAGKLLNGNQWLKWSCETGGGFTWPSQIGTNPIPIPHPTNSALFGHKITL